MKRLVSSLDDSLSNPFGALESSIHEERVRQDFAQNLNYFIHWIKHYWSTAFPEKFVQYQKEFQTKQINPLGPLGPWCRQGTPASQCKFIACNSIPRVLTSLANMKVRLGSGLSLGSCYYCPDHNTLHVCDNGPFAKRLFSQDICGPSSFLIQGNPTLSCHKAVLVKENPLSFFGLIFTDCKYMHKSIRVNDEMVNEYCCAIGGSMPAASSPHPSHSTNNHKVSKGFKFGGGSSLRDLLQAKATAKQSAPLPVLAAAAPIPKALPSSSSQTNERARLIILSKRLVQQLGSTTEPAKMVRSLLDRLKHPTPCNQSTLMIPGEKTTGPGLLETSDSDLAILGKILTNHRKHSLERTYCDEIVAQMVVTLFFSQRRTSYHHLVRDGKEKDAAKALKQYFHQQKNVARVYPIAVDSFMVFCAALIITPAQSPALPANPSLITQLSNFIYNHWVLICFSPLGLGNEISLDFKSVALAILFAMRRGGKTWGPQKFVPNHAYIARYLCSSIDLEHFGYKKEQFTSGNNSLQEIYESFMVNQITIPKRLVSLEAVINPMTSNRPTVQ